MGLKRVEFGISEFLEFYEVSFFLEESASDFCPHPMAKALIDMCFEFWNFSNCPLFSFSGCAVMQCVFPLSFCVSGIWDSKSNVDFWLRQKPTSLFESQMPDAQKLRGNAHCMTASEKWTLSTFLTLPEKEKSGQLKVFDCPAKMFFCGISRNFGIAFKLYGVFDSAEFQRNFPEFPEFLEFLEWALGPRGLPLLGDHQGRCVVQKCPTPKFRNSEIPL